MSTMASRRRGAEPHQGATLPSSEAGQGFVNTTFGRYRLLERLGQGGMAEVFKAKSYGVEGFEKVVVIKRILPDRKSVV